MERRDVLKGLGMTMAGTAALSGRDAHAASAAPDAAAAAKSGLEGKMLVNKPRAYRVLEELGLDGIVALNPINVYYLSNTWPLMTKFRVDYPAFATFARDPGQPSFLVAGGAEILDVANGERETPELITWTGAANWHDYVNASPEQMKVEPKAFGGSGRPVDPNAKLTAREKRWVAAQQKYGAQAAASPAWALAKALKQSGLAKGRIAVDDMRIAHLLQQIGMEGITFVPGEQVFRRIRVVKSDAEIALQRIAGRNNAEAAMATVKAIHKGMTFPEIEKIFAVECAKRGNEQMEFIAGFITGLFPEGVATPGKSFVIDAVSHYKQYHGDFGRTVVLGEPSKDLIAREKAHKAGHDAVYAIVKPGVRLSELRKTAIDAEVKAGLPAHILSCTPHGVGLEHGDNPSRLDVPFGPPEDIALEENMVITIDLPYIEIGGNIGHHEDLIRITKTGFEPMNELGDPLVVI